MTAGIKANVISEPDTDYGLLRSTTENWRTTLVSKVYNVAFCKIKWSYKMIQISHLFIQEHNLNIFELNKNNLI